MQHVSIFSMLRRRMKEVVVAVITALFVTLITGLVKLVSESRVRDDLVLRRTEAEIRLVRLQIEAHELELKVVQAQQVLDNKCNSFSLNSSDAAPPFLGYRIENSDLVFMGGQNSIGAEIAEYPPGSVVPADSPQVRFVVKSFLEEVNSSLLSKANPETIFMEIAGGTDGLPVRAGAIYKGEFGNFATDCIVPGSPSPKRFNFIAGQTPLTNENIGVLRCQGIHRSFQGLPLLARVPCNYTTINTVKVGGEFRRVFIRVRFRDFFPTVPANQSSMRTRTLL